MSVTCLPLVVLFMNPSCNRNGSITSSIVVCSSPIDAAILSIPTGPPLNLLIRLVKYSMSVLSNPYSSTCSLFKLEFVISFVIIPSPFTKAKSLTLFKSLFAILGVFLLLLAIIVAAASSISSSNTLALLFTIVVNSSVV